MPDDGQATMAKWGRKMERREDEDRKAKQNMKKVISAAMKDSGTKRNITNQMVEARKGPAAKHREGFGDDGEIFTGLDPEDQPWERD
jgi:hypothetical protein